MISRRAMIYLNEDPGPRKGEVFDVGMGFFDGAEVCEIVGLFILEELEALGIKVGIYRDDGLAVSELTPQWVTKANISNF